MSPEFLFYLLAVTYLAVAGYYVVLDVRDYYRERHERTTAHSPSGRTDE